MLASNSTPSHFFEQGFLHHAREARASGATMRELLGVLAVVGTMGTQSFLLGASILREEQAAAEHNERVAELRRRHVELLGAPIPEAEDAMHADPGGYGDWLDLANACFGPDCALGPRVAHLVAIATAELSAPAVRQHVRGALAAGAVPEEILEVCQLVVGMGSHPMLKGAPLLLAEFGDEAATSTT
jgi:alkylhydroperoxidase/carboxymuconolactone decarboxylase family protein YurZ